VGFRNRLLSEHGRDARATQDVTVVIDLPPQLSRSPLRVWVVRWLLFFLISLGLGYAAVQRYDPRQTAGLTDSAVYYRLAAGERVDAREMRFRILVPYVARPFHAVLRKFVEPPRSVFLSLLISNAIFIATTACLIVLIGLGHTPDPSSGLLGACLYLLNFAVTNLYLAAMVDAGEAFVLLAVTVTLSGRRWWLLPFWGLIGTLAKETFVPLATVLTLVWWYVVYRKDLRRRHRLFPVIVMVLVMIGVLTMLRWSLAGASETVTLFEPTDASGAGLGGRFSVFFSPTLWYVFIWLLPLGATRLSKLPKPWVIASICAAVTALGLGVFRDIGGNVARPLFSVLGPMLSLSAAMWLLDPRGSRTPETLPHINS
jgi:hypothetical protein